MTMGAHARLLGPDADQNDDDSCDVRREILPCVLGALLALAITVPVLYWPYQWSVDDNKRPEYSVAVAGFSGLDPDRDLLLAPALDPTFNLTLRIVEPRRYSTACVEDDSTATVFYRGVQLARGPVPGFCGQNENATEVRNVMAWGTAVTVPKFARDGLAQDLRRGDAAVDVTVASPAEDCCLQTVIRCVPRLGRGEPSPPCSVTKQHPTLPEQKAHLPRRMMLSTFVGNQ